MLDSSRFLGHVAMYDLRALRDNFDAIREQLGRRGADVPWDRLRTLIEQRRTLTNQVEQLRHELKKGSDEVAKLKRENLSADASMTAMKDVGERIKTIEDELRAIEETLTDLNLRIPNLPHASVPAGKDAGDKKEARGGGALFPHGAHRPRAIGKSAKPSAFWISTARLKSQARGLPL